MRNATRLRTMEAALAVSDLEVLHKKLDFHPFPRQTTVDRVGIAQHPDRAALAEAHLDQRTARLEATRGQRTKPLASASRACRPALS